MPVTSAEPSAMRSAVRWLIRSARHAHPQRCGGIPAAPFTSMRTPTQMSDAAPTIDADALTAHGFAAHAAEGAHGRIHAAGDVLAGFLEQAHVAGLPRVDGHPDGRAASAAYLSSALAPLRGGP